MGMQIVVRATRPEPIYAALGPIAPDVEVFSITHGTFGLSVPTWVIESIGEQTILNRMAAFEYFDLWAGVWRRPEA